MSLSDTSGEYVVAVGKASPPLAVTSAAAAGLTLQDWVMVTTITYTVLQIVFLILKFYRLRRKGDGDGSE